MIQDRSEQHGIELHARDLEVAYGNFVALRIPALELRGRVVAIIGHNGSGKSTFIKTALQLLQPRKGDLRMLWHESDGSSERLVPERHMAFSPENGAVFADISIRSYIELWCRIKHGDPNYYLRGGAEFIERLRVGPLLSRLGRELSKGQRRRVQIAVGFITRPRVFLFDEPFDGLDVQQASDLAEVMYDAAKEMALFVSSHRMDVVERLADRIIVLKHGEVLTAGPLDDVCGDLSEKSVHVTLDDMTRGKAGDLVQELRKKYSACLAHHIGSQIVVTGREVSAVALEGWLGGQGIRAVKVETVKPTLIDAMNYHLKHYSASLDRAANDF
ncbi:MAG: ABC transporter ATP-binding protein [Deltaproteobacteria bacterium]|nr:ABC transporter ATP-binding protein [Deltaproteobacteria bacterium]